MRALFEFQVDFHARAYCFCYVACAANTTVVQLRWSLSGWFQLNCSSICTGFNEAETNYRIVHSLGILLRNSNCFAIYLQQHSSYVCSDIYLLICLPLTNKLDRFGLNF